MARMNYHMAPGLGDLIPGWFVVPQNPIQAAAQGGVKYIPKMGELIGASFVVPQNPLKRALGLPEAPPSMLQRGSTWVEEMYAKAKSAVGLSGMGCGGCGCGGSCGGCGMSGITDSTIDFDWDKITSGTAGWPTYAIIAGGAWLAFSMMSRGKGYREAVSTAKRRHPRRISRLAAAA